ncbi:3-dehydro-L-gulonate 2-dehydrogenase [candidate division KSB3 bacterium]|uniref:3-dehydro-L-gulonate 2-dehydrogenase n=1 Tax=candidate division KSB3 bacterium TaxID=2044937 RepID=A0A2G6KG28_9BACT|nr:MAG: 3-dehydro-L-gulonate 2-dehydrogenase [candidate division KSB3 bacterium]
MRVSFEELYQELLRVLLKKGFAEERAQLCAKIFTESSRDGVYSHGLNKFPIFVKYIDKGYVRVNALPEKIADFGSLERWDGNYGPGPLNAHFCMNRSIELAKEHGIGCVALRNTNHWMRGGTYGWQAADAGCIAICFTNTIPNMPPWGGAERRIGNNPFVIAVPREGGHIVLDMAMSLFSYGKMGVTRSKGELLPFDGGHDSEGHLTRDPDAILKSKRPLPAGYWKGSGLSIMLDLLVTILSEGRASSVIGEIQDEKGVSQCFLCIDTEKQHQPGYVDQVANTLLDDLHDTPPLHEGGAVSYPGERTLKTRQENIEKGIPVDEKKWQQLKEM